jgi:hypothetical protein
MNDLKEFDPPLDPGIKHEVEILFSNRIETYESCQGGPISARTGRLRREYEKH